MLPLRLGRSRHTLEGCTRRAGSGSANKTHLKSEVAIESVKRFVVNLDEDEGDGAEKEIEPSAEDNGDSEPHISLDSASSFHDTHK